ncbi:MAG: hypothetical protein WAL29_10570 [Bacteroidales bacterium]
MNSEEIKRLLERYYNAETSEDEELELRSFFDQEVVPDDLRDEKEIFFYYDKVSDIQGPSGDFERKIIASIDDYEDLKAKKSGYRRILFTATGIAAGILILAGTYFFFARESEPVDTFSDPQIAYAETMKILYDVSARLNKGTEALEVVGMMQEVTRQSLDEMNMPAIILEEKLKPLGKLNIAMEAVEEISDEKNK